MKVVIAGGHGTVARLTTRRLVEDGHEVVGLVRDPAHVEDLTADGAGAVVVDLEHARTAEVAAVLTGADAVVFAAGAGPGSGPERKDAVDRGAAVLLADAAEVAEVRSYLLLSSTGVEQVRDGARPDGVDDVMLAYLRAKLAAEEDVLARPGLDVVVLRPGSLTDEPAGGRVRLSTEVLHDSISRDDVAAVMTAVLEAVDAGWRGRGAVLECTTGEDPVAEAVTRALGAG